MALTLAGAEGLWAQATTSLRGAITDPSGAVIVGASVLLQSEATGFRRQALTDSVGAYQFVQIPPGVFSVLAEVPGFATLSQDNVELKVNTPATLNLVLTPADVTETVSVVAEVSQINTVDAAVGNAFNETQVRQLPLLTRNVVELLSLQPGVTATGEVLGARRDQNNVTLDGVDVNDNQTAGLEGGPNGGFNNSNNDRPGGFNAALPVPLDSVQEFRVTVAGQGANQGRSSGGQVALVTKSGTNDFHGTLYEFHRNTVTSANNWFNNRSGVAREPLIRNQFGGSLGGRIIRDRAFFFFNYEQRLDRSGASVNRAVPSETFKQGIIGITTNDGQTRMLSPDQIREIDPLHAGVSPAMLSIFNQMPAGNDPGSGRDRGLNFSVFRFNAPLQLDNKAYVAKMDFHLDRSGFHTLSLRGTLADNGQFDPSNLAQYPGQPPASQLFNNSRGLSATYTAVLSPTVVNVASFGITRIGIEKTGSLNTEFSFDTFDSLENYKRGYIRIAPTYNFADDVTWTKSSHTITAGANIRVVQNDRTDYTNAFPQYRYSRGSLAGLGDDIVQAADEYLAGFTGNSGIRVTSGQNLSRAFGDMLGVITSGQMTYSYDRQGSPLPIGVAPLRQFASNDVELYLSDSWRATPSLTLTYGLRWTRFGVPYERNGLQVAPTFPAEAFYAERYGGMLAGIPTFQLPHAIREYDWNGPANGTDSWYRPDNNNFGPRVSMAYSPRRSDGILGKIFGVNGVFRAGGAVVYDRFGSQIVTNFDSAASFGLTEIVRGPSINFTTGPRYYGEFPQIADATQHDFPFTPPNVDFIGGNYMGIATNLRAPYSMVLNASFAREIPGGLTVEVSYAGRLSRGELMQIDAGGWALLFKDPQSGITWKEMAREMRDYWNAGVDPRAVTTNPGLIAKNPFIENQMAGLTNFFFPGSASANYYNLLWGQMGGSDADATHQVDRIRRPELGGNCMSTSGCFTFYPPQSSGSSTWMNVGFANYHGATLTLRKPFSNGVSFDFNYTLSHSIDNGGAPESGGSTHAAIMLNPFEYGAYRGSSDFDIRHNINANVLYQLPFGRGQMLLGNAPGWLNQMVAGWQVSSIMRYRSGLPSAISYTGLWPTNFSFTTIAYPVASYNAKVQINEVGNPAIFPSTSASASNWLPMYPGEVGQRAAVRLDDFLNFDIAVAKSFLMPWEGHRLQFRAEAFNAFNNVNFLDLSVDAASPSNFGQFTTASSPRVMQFALRYEF